MVRPRLVPRTLDRYIAGRFAALYLANLVSFTLLYVLIDSVSQYAKLSEKAPGFGSFLAVWVDFYAAQVPIIFCRILGPVTAAASGTFVVTLFHRANEFTPILCAGVSLRRQAAPVLLLTWVSVLASAAVQEVVIPGNREWIREAKAIGRGKTQVHHVKHFDQKGRNLVVFRLYNLKTLSGEGVLVFPLAGHPGRKLLIEAREGGWVEEKGRKGRWVLRDGFIQEYDASWDLIPPAPALRPPASGPAPPAPGPASSAAAPPAAPGGVREDPAAHRLLTPFDEKTLEELTEIDMLPGDLDDSESQEPYLWMGEILKKVERSPDSVRWQIRLFSRLVDPLHAFILVLIGIPTILSRGTRNIFLSAADISRSLAGSWADRSIVSPRSVLRS